MIHDILPKLRRTIYMCVTHSCFWDIVKNCSGVAKILWATNPKIYIKEKLVKSYTNVLGKKLVIFNVIAFQILLW